MDLILPLLLAAAPAPPGALAATPLWGPHADRAAACAACAMVRSLPAPSGALAAELWQDPSYHPVPSPTPLMIYRLGIQTAAGWYVRELGQDGTQCDGSAPFQVGWHLDHAATWATPDGVRLALYVDLGAEVRQKEVVLCGVGPGQAPSCLGSLYPQGDARAAIPAWDVPFVLEADGGFTLGSNRIKVHFP